MLGGRGGKGGREGVCLLFGIGLYESQKLDVTVRIRIHCFVFFSLHSTSTVFGVTVSLKVFTVFCEGIIIAADRAVPFFF